MIPRRLDDLEKEMEKCAVRRAPLGADRHHRAFWWGLGGHGAALLVQADAAALDANRGRWRDAAAGSEAAAKESGGGGAGGGGGIEGALAAGAGAEEAWLAVDTPDIAERLPAALDVRGAREKELRATLEKVRGRGGARHGKEGTGLGRGGP
jgi:hypothetical protein